MEGDGSPFGSDMAATLDPQMYNQLVVDEWVNQQGEVFAEETEGATEAIIEDWGVEDCQGHSGPSLINTPNKHLCMVRLSQKPGN